MGYKPKHFHWHRSLGGLTFPLDVVNSDGEAERVICTGQKVLPGGDRTAQAKDGRTFLMKHPSLTFQQVADDVVIEDDDGEDA